MSELKARALEKYVSVKGADPEQLVSGSDDFTLFLWHPGESRKPIARMTGMLSHRACLLSRTYACTAQVRKTLQCRSSAADRACQLLAGCQVHCQRFF